MFFFFFFAVVVVVVVSTGTLSLPATCDHWVIYPNFNCQKHKPKPFAREIWNFNNVDLDTINITLSSAAWNVALDVTIFDIDVIYHRLFLFVSRGSLVYQIRKL